MSFTRVKPAGWAFGELLTSSQMNLLDIDHAASASSANCDEEQDRTGAQIPLTPGNPTGNNFTGWGIATTLWLLQNDVAITGRWIIDLCRILPHGVTVTEVQALAHGDAFAAGTHGGSMPTGAGRPELFFTELTAGASSYSVSQVDTTVDGGAGAYETDHAITLTVSRTVDRVLHYYVQIKGETGGNALNGHFAVKALSISWTAP